MGALAYVAAWTVKQMEKIIIVAMLLGLGVVGFAAYEIMTAPIVCEPKPGTDCGSPPQAPH